MIRVKVFRLKEVIVKILFGISILVVLYFVFTILLRSINAESRTFAANIVEENINYDYAYLDNELNIQLLRKELGILNKVSKDDAQKGKEDSVVLVKEDYNDTKNFEIKNEIQNKYLETNSVKTWDRPKSYVVNQLSSGKVQVGNSYLINYANKKFDLDLLSKVSDFSINSNTNILIVHTHTSEAYSEVGVNTNFRTLDDSKNVVSVGNVLEKNLLLKNFLVKHVDTKHDTPSYNGAYKACLKTVEEEFKKTKYDIVLDIHRDALSSNLNYRPTTEINGESAAKLMFVVGTNASGLSHDNWMENLRLALLIQNTANDMYPGLFRDLNLSKSRYNQNVCDGALILEVGATGNTLDEVWNAMKYFSNVLEALKN